MIVYDVPQGSGEWLRMRLGMITGTRLKSVMGGKDAQKTLMYELVAEQLTGLAEDFYETPAMRWGTEHEADGAELYAHRTKSKPEVVGFCVSDEFPYLALSPDRLIKKGEKYVKGVEVKCPTSKVAIKYRYEMVIPKEYQWQVVNYFLVCEDLKSLDLVVYDPRVIKPEGRLTVIPVTRKELQGEIDEAKERLVEFREAWREVYESVTK